MPTAYDKYYQNPDYFGKPYPELLDFFSSFPNKGRVIDMGCGQGRDAIALARIGFEVLGLDNSQVGINQVNQVAKKENLKLKAELADIYSYDHFETFDFVLYNSMFHFQKNDREKELGLINLAISNMKLGAYLVICIQDSGNKVQTLLEALEASPSMSSSSHLAFEYVFEDEASKHMLNVDYKLVTCRKVHQMEY